MSRQLCFEQREKHLRHIHGTDGVHVELSANDVDPLRCERTWGESRRTVDDHVDVTEPCTRFPPECFQGTQVGDVGGAVTHSVLYALERVAVGCVRSADDDMGARFGGRAGRRQPDSFRAA